jgi:hypothetical protein
LKLVFVEKSAEARVIFRIARYDAVARKWPVILLANGNDLAWIPCAEITKRIVTRDTGDAGDEQRKRNGFVRA